MATITFDTELMVNQIAATPAVAGVAFTTVLDPKTRRPAVISISNDGPPVLQLVMVLPPLVLCLWHTLTFCRRTIMATVY